MPLFVITYEHPNEEGWRRHVMAHVAWLNQRLEDNSLMASGPFEDQNLKSALMIMKASDREPLEAVIATDPFAIEGLIENMVSKEWDAIFGAFNAYSSMPRPS